MGALIGRGIGATAGGSAAGAAGVAGAAAGAAFGGRFMAAARFIARGIGSLLKGSIIWGAVRLRDHADRRQLGGGQQRDSRRFGRISARPRPTWAGGEGQGWGASARRGPATAAETCSEGLTGWLHGSERGTQDWLRGQRRFGQWHDAERFGAHPPCGAVAPTCGTGPQARRAASAAPQHRHRDRQARSRSTSRRRRARTRQPSALPPAMLSGAHCAA